MKPFCLLGLLGLLTGLFLAGGPKTAGPRPAGTRAFTPNFSDRPYSATRQGTEQLSPIVQGEAWQIELVDSHGNVGEFNSLALDANDRPHISYWDRDLWVLKYAHYDGSGWSTETVDGVGHVNLDVTSLAVDSAGQPHIAYGNWDRYELRHAWHDGSDWSTETVDFPAGGASLALDAADRPHIGYTTSSELRYAHHDGTVWITETVDWAGHGIYGISLALDAAGRPHISYIIAVGLLVYAYYDGAQWVYEDLGGVGEGGTFTSLALEAAGRPHIAYNAGGWTGVWLSYRYYDGQEWQEEFIEGEYLEYVGNDGSLALDAAGRPHISYAYRADLRLAHYDGAVWWIETLGCYGSNMSLALDTTDQAHIAYDYAGDLWYASRLCTPVLGATINGPDRLPVGTSGHYSATTGPLDATPPITLTWEDDAVSSTASYSWTTVGSYPLAVTAVNPCGQVRGLLTVTVCQPLAGIALEGPALLFTHQPGGYRATSQPVTATPPLSYTWDSACSTGSNPAHPTATCRWPAPGTYTLRVTASNDCGSTVEESLPVQVVEWPERIVLPLVFRGP